jgi:hypothetical protein
MSDVPQDPSRESVAVFLRRLPSTVIWVVPTAAFGIVVAAASAGYQYAQNGKSDAIDALHSAHTRELLRLERERFAAEQLRAATPQPAPRLTESTSAASATSTPQSGAPGSLSSSEAPRHASPTTSTSTPSAGTAKLQQSPDPAVDAGATLKNALSGALKISDHRLRDETIIGIACQALRQGITDVARSAADSLSSAKHRERDVFINATQGIASSHRPLPDWRAICS